MTGVNILPFFEKYGIRKNPAILFINKIAMIYKELSVKYIIF